MEIYMLSYKLLELLKKGKAKIEVEPDVIWNTCQCIPMCSLDYFTSICYKVLFQSMSYMCISEFTSVYRDGSQDTKAFVLDQTSSPLFMLPAIIKKRKCFKSTAARNSPRIKQSQDCEYIAQCIVICFWMCFHVLLTYISFINK